MLMAEQSNWIEITIRLPKALAEKAEASGLLTDEQFADMLEKELTRQQHIDRFFDTIDQLRSLEPPITQQEIDAEIEAYKREKRERSQGTQS